MSQGRTDTCSLSASGHQLLEETASALLISDPVQLELCHLVSSTESGKGMENQVKKQRVHYSVLERVPALDPDPAGLAGKAVSDGETVSVWRERHNGQIKTLFYRQTLGVLLDVDLQVMQTAQEETKALRL